MFNNSKKKVLRSLVHDMKWFIGSTVCMCIESDAEKDYQRQMALNKTPEEKLLWSLVNEGPNPEDSIVSECERCALMGRYDNYYGPSVVDKEWDEEHVPLTETQMTALIQALTNVQSHLYKEKSE
jgi:hypothetical protein